MALDIGRHWAVAIAVGATLGLAAATLYVAKEYLKDTPTPLPGSCENAFYANGADCLAKDESGNIISIDSQKVYEQETPSP